MHKPNISLYSLDGQRKYLNRDELRSFLQCTKSQPLQKRLFCQLLFYTGARIAEIHNLKTSSIDFSNKTVVIETLKKKKRGIYREIPLPDFLLKDLENYIRKIEYQEEGKQLWQFSLRTASRNIKTIMRGANINGLRASAKSLRHGFAVLAVDVAPVTVVKKWLGHSSLETTAIYLDVIGTEEREIAEKIWY